MQCVPWAHVRDHLGEAPQEGSVPISPSSGWQNPSEQPGSVAEASGDAEQSAGSCCTRYGGVPCKPLSGWRGWGPVPARPLVSRVEKGHGHGAARAQGVWQLLSSRAAN